MRRLSTVVIVLAALAMLPAPAAASHQENRPVIFVHGSAGSALQFETQAKRLASNGYPAESIEAHDYDSTFATTTLDQVWAGLDARVTRLLAQTGADRVDMLGHSLGTFVMQGYLSSSPERAARVAHYVNLDGRPAAAPPGGVPTLAVWGEGDPARTIAGATNVSFPDQSHTQVVTSDETFVEIYRFFTGREPRTTAILPGPTLLSGRAVLFPTNVGVTGARLDVYEVGTLTGIRLRRVAAFELAGDGSFGPFRAKPWARYEFAIVRPDGATHHTYYQPFRRTDRLIRLLTSLPGQGVGALMETSDHHTNLIVNRNKEWWGGEDALWINGTDVVTAAIAPRSKRVIGIFVYDRSVDRVSDLSAPIPAIFAQPFLTGVDLFVPAAPAHLGLVFVVTRARDGDGRIDWLTVPNWPSTDHRSTLQVDDVA